MKPSLDGPTSKLTQAWRALVKAFTPTHPSDLTQGFGEADTTLFGPSPDAGENAEKSRSGLWQQTGESSYFADSELHGKDRKLP
jgi:hypothetical protein